MSRLTLHFQTLPGWAAEFARRSAYVKVIDPPEQNPFADCGVRVIGRTFEDDALSNERIWQGKVGAEGWFRRWLPFYRARSWAWAWESTNEPQPMGNRQFRRKLDEFTVELARLMRSEGLKLVGHNFSVGWPDYGHIREFGASLEAIDYLGLHEYGAPYMNITGLDGGYHWTLRCQRLIEEARGAGLRVPPIVVGECGIDLGVSTPLNRIIRPQHGWLAVSNDEQNYAEQLRWYESWLPPEVVTACVFSAGAQPPWGTFEINESMAMRLLDADPG